MNIVFCSHSPRITYKNIQFSSGNGANRVKLKPNKPNLDREAHDKDFSTFTNIAPLLEKMTFRQMSQMVLGMLVASRRITILGLSLWIEKVEATELSSFFIIVSFHGIGFHGYFLEPLLEIGR